MLFSLRLGPSVSSINLMLRSIELRFMADVGAGNDIKTELTKLESYLNIIIILHY